jgi:hypothetical protein
MSASAPALLLVGRRLGSWQSTAGQIAFDDYFRVSAAVATRNRKRRAEGRTLPQGRRPAPLRGKSPSLLHLQHEARCGSYSIPLLFPVPIPLEAPVTSATLPSKMPIFIPHRSPVSSSDHSIMVSAKYLVSITHLNYTKGN